MAEQWRLHVGTTGHLACRSADSHTRTGRPSTLYTIRPKATAVESSPAPPISAAECPLKEYERHEKSRPMLVRPTAANVARYFASYRTRIHTTPTSSARLRVRYCPIVRRPVPLLRYLLDLKRHNAGEALLSPNTACPHRALATSTGMQYGGHDERAMADGSEALAEIRERGSLGDPVRWLDDVQATTGS